MPDLIKHWTREEVLALPEDGNRYELLDGELLVTPAPRFIHQTAAWALYDRIQPYVLDHRLGRAGLSPSDLDFRSGQLLQPDLFVYATSQNGPLEWPDIGIPILVVEVPSPSTAVNDRNRKRRRYQESGVGEYWIVDTDARLIERWRSDDQRPEILRERIEWHPRGAEAAPLSIVLAEYFREVWGTACEQAGERSG